MNFGLLEAAAKESFTSEISMSRKRLMMSHNYEKNKEGSPTVFVKKNVRMRCLEGPTRPSHLEHAHSASLVQGKDSIRRGIAIKSVAAGGWYGEGSRRCAGLQLLEAFSASACTFGHQFPTVGGPTDLRGYTRLRVIVLLFFCWLTLKSYFKGNKTDKKTSTTYHSDAARTLKKWGWRVCNGTAPVLLANWHRRVCRYTDIYSDHIRRSWVVALRRQVSMWFWYD